MNNPSTISGVPGQDQAERLEKIAASTPLEQRPLICCNGVTGYMNDRQFRDYLLFREAHPVPADPEPTSDSLEPRVTRLEQDLSEIKSAYREGVNHA